MNSIENKSRRAMSGRKRLLLLTSFLSFILLFIAAQEASAYQVKRVVKGTSTLASGTEIGTIDLTAVDSTLSTDPLDLTKTLVFATVIQASGATGGNDARSLYCIVMMDDTTHILLKRFQSSYSLQIDYFVVEFSSGVQVTSGLTTVNELLGSKNITLPVSFNASKTFAYISNTAFASATNTNEANTYMATLTAPSTLTVARPQAASGYNSDVYYQVVEFVNDPDVNVQSGTVRINNSVGTGETTDNGTVLTATVSSVDTTKTFLVQSLTPSASVNGNEEQMYANGVLTNATTLTFQRNLSTNYTDISYFLVEFKNQAYVQNGTSTITSTSGGASNVGVSAVTLDRAFAVNSRRSASGVTNNGEDEYGVSMQLSATNNLQFSRATTTAAGTPTSWFAIELPPLDVTSPNGTEVWKVGETRNITWTHSREQTLDPDGAGAKTHHNGSILLSVNNGSSYPLTIVSGIDLTSDVGSATNNEGSYAWTIPASISSTDLIGTQLKVKVVDDDHTADARNFDVSNAAFEIKGTLSLTAPTGGETWYIGSANNITWGKTGNLDYSTVTIKLSLNGGGSYPTTIVTGRTPSSLSYSWTPGNSDDGQTNRVRVELASDPTNVYSESPANFTVRGSITVTAPNGTEEWPTQTDQAITWTRTGAFANVKIEYSTNSGGAFPTTVVASTPADPAPTDNSGTYTWSNIPSSAVSTFGRIKVTSTSDANVSDMSDADFSIVASLTVTSPTNGTEVWRVGDLNNITWHLNGTMANVKIEYSKDNFSSDVNLIVGSTPADPAPVDGDGSYPWTIPDDLSSTAKVRVSNALNAAIYDISDSNFKIRGNITVVSPNGGEVWPVGSSQLITWAKDGTLGNVDILYSINGGSSYPNTLATNQAGTTWNWNPIPDVINSNLKVKVRSVTYSTDTEDESNAAFAIKGSFTLISPNGNEQWGAATDHDITWSHTGTLSNATLEYDENSGLDGFPSLITNSVVVDDGTYTWTLPSSVGTNYRVRIKLNGDSTVFDTSNADFSVRGSVTLTAPNGGQAWVVGTQQNITWTYVGTIAAVKLEYSSDSGANYFAGGLITNSAPVNQAYTWTVADAIGTQMRIRVSDANDSTVNDESNADFEIKGSLTLTAPNGGESWVVGSSQNVTWTKTGTIASVKLDYSTNGFSDELQNFAIVASTPGGLGTYSWTIPNAIGTTLKVRVSNVADATVKDESDFNFGIKGSVTITAPNGGESWSVGSSQNITWSKTGTLTGNMKLEYSADNGSSWPVGNLITNSVLANAGTYAWTIPDSPTVLGLVRATQVDDTSVTDTSDGNFSIKGQLVLTAPNGGETWIVGENRDITWNRIGSIANARLDYSINHGSTYPTQIVASTPAVNQSYTWTIPDAIGTGLRVKVTDANDSGVSDDSNADFEIKGSLTITSPNGGETWVVGNVQNITWTKTGTIANVKLEYSSNAFSDELQTTEIVASTPGANLSYGWTIPDALGSNLKVRITNLADSAVTDVSNAAFAIKGSLTVGTPNGGETWIVGDARNIVWSMTGSISNVKLEYSTNGFNDELQTYQIVASTPAETDPPNGAGSGQYAWTVADAIGTNLKVRVTDAANSTVSDISNAAFTVKGSIQVTAPNGGEVWAVLEDHTISWTTTGTIQNVEIRYSTDSGGSFGNVITNSTPADPAPVDNAGSYVWTIPDNITIQARVRVINVDDSSVLDDSNANFKIRGGLQVTTPNGGQKWTVGDNQNISWNKFGTITSTVKLEYSTNGFSDELQTQSIATGLNVVTASPYAWVVADDVSQNVKVRVTSEADSDTVDVSDASFKIMPKFTVTAPNGGEVWSVASSQTIGWTTVGSCTNVKLDYSTDGGNNYNNAITASTSNTGSYSWTVPDAIGTAARVQVQQAGDVDAFDRSNANFKIRGVVLTTAPNGGEAWNIGSSHNITWNITGSIANVKLEYSTNGFSDELATTVIIASTPADPAPVDGSGTYSWTIPDTPSSTVKVRVSDASDSTAFDTSNANFSVRGSLALNIPNGGETWVVATTQNVQWTRTGSIQNVKLEYSTDSGSTWPVGKVIVASTPADPAPADNIGIYSWTIPDEIGTQLRVRVSDAGDASVEDTSNADFEVKGAIAVTSPNGGEIWIVGENQNVTWNHDGSFLNVKLEYSTNAFSNETQTTVISASTPNDGSYSWAIPDAIGTNLKIRASDAADSAVVDVSNAAFEIKGSLTVTSPNGGEVWKVGENRSITWNRTGSISTAKLEYSTTGGAPFPNTITASTDATAGTYSWVVPDAIGAAVRVQITNLDDTSVKDSSDANFQIKGTLTMTSPNGSEVWAVNSLHNITWTKTGTQATVKLEYSTNAFADELQTTVIATGVDAATGTPYGWTVPDAIGSALKVRVTNENDTTVNDISDLSFKIVGALTLVAPNGGENWAVGASKTVSWTRVGSIANVKLEYSVDSGSDNYPNVIVASTGAGAGAYLWTIPDDIGSTRRVKITDASDSTVYDTSDADFTIKAGFAVTSPNGGEVWTVGSAQSLTWTTFGTVSNVKLEFSTNAFSDELQTTVIAANTSNTGTYSWTVADAISTLVRLRVSDVNNSSAKDISDASAKIRGALLVNAPNGGEAWFIGNSQNIQWTRTGSIANVKIEYSSDAFADELQTTVIIASTPADPAPADNVGIYAWTIPDEPGTTNKVRVTDASDATVLDTSNANFSIKGQLVMTSPNGGEVWTVGNVNNITWSKFGAINNVSLQFSTDSGGTWPGGNVITASTAADPAPVDNIGVYSWNIPDQIGTQLRIRVVDTADSSTYDDSNADFKIRGSITITAPNGGENWVVGTSQNITWNHTGSFSNVKLEYSTNGFSDELQTTIITGSTPNNGSYSWGIPDIIGTTVKVRASDVSDSSVVDSSDANFTVKGALVVTSPNGTEVWKVGESRNITWNRSGSIANVKIEYSTNGGSAYPNTIIASTGAGSGTYSWSVPDAIGSQLRVKVSDVSDATVSDASDANFTIKGTVTVISPNGGEVWAVNSQQNITWSKTGTYATVSLEYSTNAFADELQTTTIATGIDSVTGTPYVWTIPDAIGSQLRVRVTNEADATVKDTSDLSFKIVGAFTLTAPNGGENWAVGASKTVTWTRTGSIANAKLELSSDGGSTYPDVIVASTGAAAQAYIWTIPDLIASNHKVKISDASDASVFDVSDANFTIMGSFAVTAPNGGEVWTVGSAQSLTWNTTGTVANVKLEYSTNAFSNESQTTEIIASTPNTGTYSWTVADAISNLFRIRVSDVNNSNASDISNASAKIRGALLVTAPNGGEQWLVGNSQNIAWSRTGSIANVKLEYSTNGFADELETVVILASTPADPAPSDNAGIYSWTIPDAPSTNVKIRVTDASDSTVLDTSNSGFSIKGQLILQIPNGGEVWTVGSVSNIQWTKFGSISNVSLQYSTDSGGTWPGGNVITASTAADPAPVDDVGVYSWNIPDQIGTHVRVRVVDAADSSTYDDSNADFKIKGAITITAPNGGENWIVGTSQNITWSHAGSFANVKLEYSTNGFSDELQTVTITSSTPNNGSYAWGIPDAIGTLLKVRASDASDSTVNDSSDAAFTIKGALVVTSPNGGETWKVGENRNVTWNRSGSIANVKLEYSTNGGSAYPNTIVASTDASSGTYSWTVPDAIGSQLRVQVSAVGDATVNDASDANFTIKGTVTVTSPNGGEVWVVGSQHNITWTKTGTYATVSLEYSTNAFADELQTTTIATGVDSVTGTPYVWTVPDTIGTQLRIRVTNESDTSVKDTSDLNFKIAGALTLVAPNGGENWAVGASKTVTWSRTGSIANAKLELSSNGGSTYPDVIVASTGAAAEAYIWTIPDMIGTNRKVKISDAADATVFDVSDANFSIIASFAVTAPNGGEVWTVASAQSLTWNTTGTVSNVKLEYSTNAFSDESQTTQIIASTPNTGTYSWTVGDAISNLFRIRVSDVNNSNAFDISNASAKIRGALLVTAPNGGEPWEIGTSQNIAWTRTGSIANVKLEYSTNGFSDELQTAVIIATTPADPAPADNNGTYAWTIPDAPSTTVKVRVTDASDSTVLDTSNANFIIKGRLVLSVPNGSEIWTVAGVQNVQWTKFGSITNVALYYSTDSGNTWPGANLIVASTAADPAPADNAGFYSWTIPDEIGTQVRVRVQDAADSSTYDDSDADFKIRGAITVTSPNGGEVWIVGASQNITWNHAGSFSNVKLEYSTNGFSDENQTFSITAATPNNGSFAWSIPDAIGSTVKVRASDASDSTVNDASNANFTIKGALLLTSPNGGEVWKVGENRNITWNRTGSIANVKLEYSTNGGSSYSNTITSSTGAGSGTYAWAVPDAIGSQLRIQVSDVSDATVNDASDANFQIKGTVTLTSPNGGEVWTVDALKNITWTKTGTYATVKLEYSTNAFVDELQTTVIATGVDSVTGTPYAWTVPDTIGTQLRVRVTNESDATVTDSSDLNFKIAGSLTLTAPNGSENWPVGTQQTITWVRIGSIANVKLEYSINGGSTYPNVIAASTGAAAEAYLWTIPDSIGLNRRVKISDASDASVGDTSDANFTIMGAFAITSPNGGEVWTVASGQLVTWTTTGSVSNVKLEYSTNAFSDETQTGVITANVLNSGSFSWTVNDAISNLVRLRVSDVNNANAFDQSDASFKIRGALTVNAPNGGESWLIAEVHNIQWTRTGSIPNVKLEYSSNGFSDELQTTVIIASTPADPAPADNIGLYAWTIPDDPTTTAKVRVTDASDSTVLDTSNANFSIKGRLVMTVPNGGEVWTVNGVNNITWNKFGSISNVQLQYSTDSGSTWPGGNIIVASTAADPAPADNIGVYSWTIPDAIGTHLMVRVQDTADSSTYDDSDADFKVHGAITITSPNGGEVWIVGANQNVTWNHAGSFSNVKLEYSTNAFADESQTFSITTATPNTDSYSWSIPDAIGSSLRVRASDAADVTVVDSSDNNFTIKGSLTLTSPNGSEIWKVGENRAVTWNKSGSIANVKLEYSNNGGSTYPNSIIASTNAGTGTYTWSVPDAIGTQLRVRVSNVDDASVNDTSNANFEIKGTITLVTPNGSEQWPVNTTQNITWVKTGTYSTVKLEYSTNAFADELQTTIIATGVDAVTGTPYGWVIPDTIGSSTKVRVTNEADAAVTDKSDNTFKIVGSLTLTAPNGGENWNVGTNHTVSWDRVGSIANVKLEYSSNGGTSYPNLITASTGAGAGAYTWTIPDSIGTNRRVKVTDASDSTVSDTSDANFAIVASFNITQPNGGEVWTVASIQNIIWTTTGSVANVKLLYSVDNGTDGYANVITNSTPNNLTYSWTIPDTISTLMKVRISDVNNDNGFDTSNAVFKIRGAITVNAPNGGEQWGIGINKTIQWTTTGSIANVKLEYSTNGFSDELQTAQIVASAPADPAPTDNVGTYTWLIPDVPSTTVKVRVTDVSDATVLDTSNAVFSIKGSLTITAPNGNEKWIVGTPYNITWVKGGAISNVKLQYSTDSGSTWPDPAKVITASTSAGFLSYTWTIPDDINNKGRVRILDTNDNSVNDTSDADFAIKGSLHITSPDGTEIWTVGDSHNITWTKTGTIANIMLEYSTDGGATYPGTITASTAASTGSYAWVIPDSISTQVRVKITQTNDSFVTDASDADFKIRGSLTVTSPNGGEVWRVANNQPITWTKTGTIPTVKIEYSTNGGATFPNVIATSVDGSSGSYSWTIPNAITTNARVRITNEDDTSVFDISDSDFKIAGSITVLTPNGGEKWAIGSNQNITWSITGSISSVKLEYSTDGGSTYPNTIVGSVDATAGTPYSWAIPDSPTTQARVKITNAADATVFDTSNANFKIQGSVTVTAPNGGEAWGVSEVHSVIWTKSGSFANVKIDYSTDGGTTYPNIVVGSTPSDNLSYGWTIPDNISTTARIKVSDVNDGEVTDTSDGNFTIRGSMVITAPNGGEIWRVGQAQNITWTVTGTVVSAQLEYSTNSFTDETQTYTIVSTTPAANLSYAWNIPDTISGSVKVRISDVAGVSLGDSSNGSFSIKGLITVTSPNGGESYGVANNTNITWDRTGSFANVKLEYSTNAFADESQSTLITASAPADPAPVDNHGTFAWVVPDAISTTVKVRVTDANDAATTDTSNNNFTIHGILTITAPNGGEKWIVGTAQLITWDRFGSISNVKLQYTTNGSIYTDIIGSTPNTGTYAWTIPNSVSTTVKVRIYDANNSTVTDDSDANFKIQAGFTLSSPNGGESWLIGSTQTVSWTTFGTVPFVRLDYSTDSGATYPNQITTSTGNSGTYSWVVPDSVSGAVRVRVSDTNDVTANDESNADLRIRATINVVAPNGSEQWRVGRVQNVTWGMVGTIPNVKIQYSRDGFFADIQTIALSAPNTGSYAWTLPDSISNTVRVKISDPNDIGAYDTSNADFRITGDFAITAPNGGEKWDVDSTQAITWNHAGTVANAKLEYSTNAGGSWSPIVGLTPNNGSFDWIIPDSITANGRVQISDPNDATANDISDANFKIKAAFALASPNGGEIWTVAESHNIAWSNTGTVPNVKMWYSNNGGSTFSNVIIATTANIGTYSWTIPDAISTQIRVRIGSTTDVDGFDDSDANLKIRGKFQITAPNGTEAWKIALNQNITWVTTGTIANVKLYYSTDSGSTYPNVIANSVANTDSYVWNVPDVPTTTARIRVENPLDATVYDDSDANFKIQGNFALTAPNGGESWVVGSSHNIAWTWGGTIPNVKLTYSTDSGSNYSNVISASTPNGAGSAGSASYAWTVPDSIASTVRVKIEDPNDNTVFDASDADFKIRGDFALTSPLGGERWVTYENRNITWATTGTVPDVKLTYSFDDFGTSTVIIASTPNTNSYSWSIPDPGINNIPKSTKVRLEDTRDSNVNVTSNAFNIDYYYITWDIRDLLTNAPLSDLIVKQTKNDDETFVQWQETGITTNPPRVQPTPAGIWGTVFKKTGYGDLVVVVPADHDQSFQEYMETTVIHLWLADSRVSYNPTTKMLDVTAWLSRDGSITIGGAVSATWQIGQGANTLGDFVMTRVTNPALISPTNPTGDTGYFNAVVDAGPGGLNLQSGVVYRTLTTMPIATGGQFKTPSSFEITAAKTLQDVSDTVNTMLDKPLSQVESAIRTDMTNQLTDQKNTVTNLLNDQTTTITTKLDNQTTLIHDQLEDTKNTVKVAIDDFTAKSTKAVYNIEDSATKAAIRIISPDTTKLGKTETIRVSTEPLLPVPPSLDFFCPNGNTIETHIAAPTATPGIYAVDVNFGRTFKCAVLSATTIVATATIPSKDPAEVAFIATAVGSLNITSTDLDTIQGLAAAGLNAERAAKEAKEAIADVAKALTGSQQNIPDAIAALQQKIDRLPAMLQQDKSGETQIKSAVDEVLQKLDKFMGTEGYDLRSILKEEIGSGLKGVRNKVDRTMAATNVMKEIIERKVGKSDEPIIQTFYEIG